MRRAFLVCAAILAMVALAASESETFEVVSDTASYAKASSFVGSFLKMGETKDKAKGESECEKMATDVIDEIGTMCKDLQKLVNNLAKGKKGCCDAGKSHVCEARASQKAANVKKKLCKEELKKINAMKVSFPSVSVGSMVDNQVVCASMFSGSTNYGSLAAKRAAKNKECSINKRLLGSVFLMKTMDDAHIRHASMKKDCHNDATANLEKVYTDSKKNCESAHNAAAFKRAKHMLCVLKGTPLAKCKTGSPPKLSPPKMTTLKGLKCASKVSCPGDKLLARNQVQLPEVVDAADVTHLMGTGMTIEDVPVGEYVAPIDQDAIDQKDQDAIDQDDAAAAFNDDDVALDDGVAADAPANSMDLMDGVAPAEEPVGDYVAPIDQDAIDQKDQDAIDQDDAAAAFNDDDVALDDGVAADAPAGPSDTFAI